MELKKVAINELKKAEYNPRVELTKDDEEYKKIKASIQEFGYVDPLIINSDYTIIGGHQRYTVLKELDYKEIDCIVIDVDKTKEKALNIALNKISGEWDVEKLKVVLEELQNKDFDTLLTGFDTSEIEDMLTSTLDINDEDFLQGTEIVKDKKKNVCPECGFEWE